MSNFRRRRIEFFQFHPETGKENNPKNPVNPVKTITLKTESIPFN